MVLHKFILVYSTLILIPSFAQVNVSPDIVIKSAEKSVDLSSQVCKVTNKLVYENTGKSSVSNLQFAVEPSLKNNIAFISGVYNNNVRNSIRVTSSKTKDSSGTFWTLTLNEPLGPGKTVSLEIEYLVIDALIPYPTAITQKEKQLVKFSGNAYIYSPYKCLKQTSTFHLSEKNVEQFTKVNPSSQSSNIITYGPYQNVEPLTEEPIIIHFENNSPFLKVTKIERTIQVSHWGNIAVEETIDLLHVGAILKGQFSRNEFQREAHSGISSVKSFKTILPASAADVYYRDDIGNISTSHMKMLSDSVEVDLRPRFPLFGGWKTHYTIGYNVPSYEYLFSYGDSYKLKMRILDHIFDDMIVEELITKVILPEGSEDITLSTPYPVTRLPDTRFSTYLDTKGRHVISMKANNLVENHIQDFELDYVFPRLLMLQEPFLVVIALYILFLLVIIYVRLDFSISKDEVSESRMRVSGLVEKVLLHHDARVNTYKQQEENLSKLKARKETNVYLAAMKSINQDYKNECTYLSELITRLKPDAPDLAEKVSELQKLDKHLKEIYNKKQTLYVDKMVPGKIGRSPFLEEENSLNKKKEDTIEKINGVLKSFH